MYKNAFPRRLLVSFLLILSLNIGQTALARNIASNVDLPELLSRVDLIGPIFTRNSVPRLSVPDVNGPMALGGTVSLTSIGSAYTQNFNTLGVVSGADYTAATGPTGWAFFEGGSGGNSNYVGSHGSSATGNAYSFGVENNVDRAFGGLRTGTVIPTVGASFTNNTGTVIGSLQVSYVGEQWRVGALAREDRLDFQYSLNATSLTTGTWTDVDSLDFVAPVTTPVGSRDGNAAANRTAKNATITGLSISNASTIWIRWTDFDAFGSDDGLGVDDFSMTPLQLTAPEIVVEEPEANPLTNGVSNVNFGDQTVATTSAAKSFNIRNTGTATLNIGAITKSGTNATDFTVDATGMSPTVAPGGNTMFTVTFTPSGTGVRTAGIQIANDDAGDNPFAINLMGNGTAPAVEQFTLVVTKSGNGMVTSLPAGILCGSGCEADFDEDEEVTLTAAADTGWKFVGWSGACSGSGTCVVTMDAAKTVEAEFTLITISGSVRLQNRIDRPVPLDDVLVPDVDLDAAGAPPVSGTTGVDGKYSLSGFGAGPYTVTPSKANQVYTAPNGVFIDDASLVARRVVGLEPDFTVHQIAAADVSGVAGVSSYDATLIARWVVGLTDAGNRSGKWTFTPSSVDHGVVAADIIQNYDALLFGDVNGDFEGAPPEPTLQQFSVEAADPVSVSVPNIYAQSGSTVAVPLKIAGLNGASVRSYQFDIEYDPAVVTPAAQAADLGGTIGDGLNIIYNVPSPGLLKVAVYGIYGVVGDGIYANLQFTAMGGAGNDSQLLVKNFRLNDGKTKSNAVDGSVFVTSGNGNTVSGRLVTTAGQGVRNTQVTITGPIGVKRTTFSSSLGYFEFGSLTAGGSYSLTAQSRRYRFATVGISPSNGITSVEMLALE